MRSYGSKKLDKEKLPQNPDSEMQAEEDTQISRSGTST